MLRSPLAREPFGGSSNFREVFGLEVLLFFPRWLRERRTFGILVCFPVRGKEGSLGVVGLSVATAVDGIWAKCRQSVCPCAFDTPGMGCLRSWAPGVFV